MIRTLLTQLCDIASLLAGPQHPFDVFNEPADSLWASQRYSARRPQ